MKAFLRTTMALLCLGLTVLWVGGAGAGPAVTASLDAPNEGDVVVGVVDVRASARSPAGIKRLEVSIDGFGVASKQPSGYAQEAAAQYSWSSNEGVDSASVVSNGPHTITVHAVATGGAEDSSSIDVVTNNPPVTPSGLAAAVAGGAIDVTWSANPEPDLIGYVVERDSGAGFVEVGRVRSPEFAETLVAGKYGYRVTAVRSSPVVDDGIASSPTTAVGVTVASAPSSGSGSVTKLTGRHALGGTGGLSGGGGSRASLAALLSGRTLPHAGALPAIPSPEGIEWGSYDEDLPYGEAPAAVPPELRSRTVSSSGPLSVVPPDGLRWIAAGLLLLVCAGLSQLLAAREVPAPAVVGRSRRALARWFTQAGERGWRRPS